ncbi:hypothetical protein WG907_05050 [Sphingobium sp. AN558]|uniref:hypothetical protein n=1 Tax=Sphingobium sp. AN558 TaxID=3133442 RepID=UPI0030BCAA29
MIARTDLELASSPAGNARHPWDWYVEEQWVTHALCDVLPMEPDVTYLDPFAGRCHIPDALADRGLTAFGTDLFERGDSPRFLGTHDFLGDQIHMLEAMPGLSIVMNPPFSYQNGCLVRGLAEKCIRRALSIATHRVCALLPIKWLASAGRFRLFTEHMPSGIYVLSERPSMPPGDQIAALGEAAYAHGKVDYVWIVWDRRSAPRDFAPTYWIAPREKPARNARRGMPGRD